MTLSCVLQGIKDASLLMEVLGMIFSRQGMEEAAAFASSLFASDSSSTEGYDGLFTIHMAILTANLGKRLFVDDWCLLSMMLLRLLTHSGISFAPCTDEDCNAEIFSIANWKDVGKLVHNILSSEGQEDMVMMMDDSDLEEMSQFWNNTITVTHKGAVIQRFSWPKPILWTARHARMALQSSDMVCRLVSSCC